MTPSGATSRSVATPPSRSVSTSATVPSGMRIFSSIRAVTTTGPPGTPAKATASTLPTPMPEIVTGLPLPSDSASSSRASSV